MKKERLAELGLTDENAEILLGELAAENAEKDAAISSFENEKAELVKKHNAEILSMNIDREVEKQLNASGAKNIKAVKALLQLENAEYTDKGVTGLKEQINKLKNSRETDFLFEKTSFKGVNVGESSERAQADTSNMNYSQLCAYLEENPQADI